MKVFVYPGQAEFRFKVKKHARQPEFIMWIGMAS
jgi:hypothetical protein